MSRAWTADEVRAKLFVHVSALINYWAMLPNPSLGSAVQARMEGLIFSVFTMLDGESIDLPSVDLVLAPHESDRAYHEENNENWYEPEMLLNECPLHEAWMAHRQK